MAKPFHVYRSGAGSGKTYTLAKFYLVLALKSPDAFRHILGVTFTNKATEEMKRRIVDLLRKLASGLQDDLSKAICEELGITNTVLHERSTATLSAILHQYGRFNIVTIDSFFHQVIRSFTREMGIQGTFSIDLELDRVLQLVIDKMLMEIGEDEHKQLRHWLTEFAEQKVEDGLTWDFRRDISILAREITRDEFKRYSSSILELGKEPKLFDQLKRDLNEIRFGFERRVRRECAELFDYLNQNDLNLQDFKGGQNGPLALFTKLDKLQIEISNPRRLAVDNLEAWLTKANSTKPHLIAALESFILPKYRQLIAYVDREQMRYFSSIEVLRYFYSFGILSQINRYLTEYRDENDVMLISDLPDFLRRIINESDTPFIYEKVGSYYQNYLIDEFQDTSSFQWENFKPLVKNNVDAGDLSMVVGDVKQSIYRFRGGDWELLQNRVTNDMGDYQVELHHLDTNWRSGGKLVSFNNSFFEKAREVSETYFRNSIEDIPDSVIQNQVAEKVERVFHTFEDVAQKLAAFRSKDDGAVRVEMIDESDSGDWFSQSIEKTIEWVENLQRSGYQLRDIAILTRYSSEGRKIADAFIEYRNSGKQDPDLRYEVVSSEALFLTSSHIVRFLISMIKWLSDEKDTIALTEWIYEYRHYLRKESVGDDEIFAAYQNWKQVVPTPFVRQKDYLKSLPLYELVESLIRIFELNSLSDEYTYLQGFQDAVLDYAKNERGDIPAFLQWWEEVRKTRAIQISDDNDAVKILTIHKAKGLEFPVVILPFMGWSLDHEATKDTILWCSGEGLQDPFNRIPVMPVKYSKKLSTTLWAAHYYEEKLKAYLDNLNLLYVALTRPREVLIGMGKLPKKESPPGTVSELTYSLLKDEENWDDTVNIYSSGEINEPKMLNTISDEYGLKQYVSNPWRGKVSIQLKGSAELSGNLFIDATKKGIHIHSLLSKIRYRDDLKAFTEEPDFDQIKALVALPLIANWLDTKWEVHTEVPILLPTGELKRLDRINFAPEETHVIDFKTGAARDKDRSQVKGYIGLLREMNFPKVQGFLVYIDTLKIEEVDG